MGGPSPADRAVDPLALFRDWYDRARKAEPIEPDAVTLATADRSARPSARVVLLKAIADGAFVFVTNYASRKSIEIDENPRGALLFWWPSLTRQVRVEGRVERCNDAISDRLHDIRARPSQISAWASPQSEPIRDRESLEELWREQDRRFPGRVPRPPHWGGYRLIPDRFEFWTGRSHRLHDRLLFRLARDGSWNRCRLAP